VVPPTDGCASLPGTTQASATPSVSRSLKPEAAELAPGISLWRLVVHQASGWTRWEHSGALLTCENLPKAFGCLDDQAAWMKAAPPR